MNPAQTLGNMLKIDYVLCFGAALLWLAYFFSDLKYAGMITQGWPTIVIFTVVTTVAVGPGATLGLGWLWRENTLATKHHKAALTKESIAKKEISERSVANGFARSNNGSVKVANGKA
jgi:hypothetical protein